MRDLFRGLPAPERLHPMAKESICSVEKQPRRCPGVFLIGGQSTFLFGVRCKVLVQKQSKAPVPLREGPGGLADEERRSCSDPLQHRDNSRGYAGKRTDGKRRRWCKASPCWPFAHGSVG